jgi:hypothetical protein
MKAKHSIALLVFGYCLDFVGGLFKILHSPKADTILTIAAILKILGAILLLYKVTNYPKIKEFLNK